jgi:hypothetical protein
LVTECLGFGSRSIYRMAYRLMGAYLGGNFVVFTKVCESFQEVML